ncbi:hypothetical protein TNCV_2066591 [Trichonephila clavipes]|nr:hypothetical protein TNCV_2066591 [Trichonephila clavipes]
MKESDDGLMSCLGTVRPASRNVARPSRGEERRKEGEEESEQDKESTIWRSERTCQNKRDSDYVGEDRNKRALTT